MTAGQSAPFCDRFPWDILETSPKQTVHKDLIDPDIDPFPYRDVFLHAALVKICSVFRKIYGGIINLDIDPMIVQYFRKRVPNA